MRASIVIGLASLVGCAGAPGSSDDSGGTDPSVPHTDTDLPTDTDTGRSRPTVPSDELDVIVEPGPGCEDPSLRAGAPFSVQTMPFVESEPWLEIDGSGVGIGDFDRDGLVDALVLGHEREEYLRQWAPGVFVELDSGYLAPGIDLSWGLGAAVADYDADGDLDIFVSRYLHPNVLLQNDGTGWFTDASALAGVRGAPTHRSASAAWSDVDNDGDLDLYVTGHGEPFRPTDPAPPADADYLYLNNGDGTFADASATLPAKLHASRGFVPLFLDFDDDGWRDLFVANDLGSAEIECLLLWNREGQFVLDDNAVGLDRPIPAMGIGVGDVNGDAIWDLLLPAWEKVEFMYSSSLAGVWVDYGLSVGLVPDLASNQSVGWAAELADMNNDTRLDAVVAFGQLWVPGGYGDPVQPNGLWLQGADGRFEDVAPAWGFDATDANHGMGVADLDGNGFLDVVMPSQEGPTRVYLAACDDSAWLEIALEEPGTDNPDAVGAVIEVRSGDTVQRRPMLAGGTAYGTGLLPVVHFGLGDAAAVDEIVVRWPDGSESVVSDVPTRSKVTIVRDPTVATGSE